MVIDYILDRKDGYGYDVKEFYDACMAYEEFDIARALDSGTEKDVKKALCDYVIYNDYPKSICKYINSENWLDDDFYESKKSVHKSLKESSKILAKNKKGKVVGYIEPQKDGSFGYAFGSPSQKEVIMFYVDTLEQAKDRIAEHSYDDVIFESKKSARKNLKEGISAFNKAIAKKYNETEPNSVGQYYLDWRFDLQDEKDNIEAIADRCGVTVEFQSDEGYFEVFEESKKSARKSLKEKVTVVKSLKIIERALLDLIHDDTIQEEFNMAFEDDGIYDSVDDMFEVSVHNVLNKLLKEHTITVLPF